jgi:uncharacterized surface protein with fasciclin (FAS1) repeats
MTAAAPTDDAFANLNPLVVAFLGTHPDDAFAVLAYHILGGPTSGGPNVTLPLESYLYLAQIGDGIRTTGHGLSSYTFEGGQVLLEIGDSGGIKVTALGGVSSAPCDYAFTIAGYTGW